MTNALGSCIPSVSPLFRGSVSYSWSRSTWNAVSTELSAIKVSPICLASAKVIRIVSVFNRLHTSPPLKVFSSHGLETISFGPIPSPPKNLVISTSITPDLKLVLIVIIFLNCGGKSVLPPGLLLLNRNSSLTYDNYTYWYSDSQDSIYSSY